MIRFASPLLLALTLLGGCASVDQAGYPSLERRAAEVGAAAPAPTPSPATLAPIADVDLLAISTLAAQAQAGESAFRSTLPAAQRRSDAARGQAVGSAAWFDAQAALSSLEATRAPTLAALAEFDRRYLAAEMAGQISLAALLATEQRRAAEWVSGQTAVLDRISAQLGG